METRFARGSATTTYGYAPANISVWSDGCDGTTAYGYAPTPAHSLCGYDYARGSEY